MNEEHIRLAIACTTGRGNQAPNTYRVLSWLYGQELARGCFRIDMGPSGDFLEIAAYLEVHYGIKTRTLRDSQETPTGFVAPPTEPAAVIAREGKARLKKYHTWAQKVLERAEKEHGYAE